MQITASTKRTRYTLKRASTEEEILSIRTEFLISAVRYRIPLKVIQVLILTHGDSYSICPRCDMLLDREYMHFCDRCGKRLSWMLFRFAQVVHWPRKKFSPAAH